MKKRLQGIIIGFLIGVLLTNGLVFGDQTSKMSELFYNNIKIYIDGAEITPKDANGNKVEPFTINGTTYLPVRAISNAFGKEVEWDGATQSIYIGKKDQTKPDNYLDNIQYNDLKKGSKSSQNFTIINGTVTDCNQNIHTNGLLFRSTTSRIDDDKDNAQMLIAYPLNSQYTQLKGKIILPIKYDVENFEDSFAYNLSDTDVWFYGDGKLLYKATGVNASMPFNVDINVSGVNQLTIKLRAEKDFSYIALTDLALYK